MPARHARGRSRRASAPWFREHSLSITLGLTVGVLLLLYPHVSPDHHVGAFVGNAIGDWLGVFVFVLATKYFFESGSAESRRPGPRFHQRIGRFLLRHSLTIVLAVTAAGWVGLYARSDPTGKSGQVIGNIVSDWTEVLGMVLITKYARERGSKEDG